MAPVRRQELVRHLRRPRQGLYIKSRANRDVVAVVDAKDPRVRRVEDAAAVLEIRHNAVALAEAEDVDIRGAVL